jgi:lysophospholipase L1-like esterase
MAPAFPSKFPDGPVVVLGASYAKGWHPSIPGRRIVNKGVEGQQSGELLARFANDVVGERPRAVIVWGFINDIFRSPRESLDATKARIRDHVGAMVREARANGFEPIVATEVTIRGHDTWSEAIGSLVGWALGKESYQAFINRHVTEVNTWLRGYAAGEGIFLLDLQPQVSDAAGLRRREFANADGSHITSAGYAALSRYAEPLLAAHLGRK